MLVEIGDGEGRRRWSVEGAGRILAVFKNPENGHPIVTDGRCPHVGAPMQDGWLHEGRVVCPWHRYRFRPDDGTCDNDPKYVLPVYPTSIQDGRIYAHVPNNPLGTSQYRSSRLRK